MQDPVQVVVFRPQCPQGPVGVRGTGVYASSCASYHRHGMIATLDPVFLSAFCCGFHVQMTILMVAFFQVLLVSLGCS